MFLHLLNFGMRLWNATIKCDYKMRLWNATSECGACIGACMGTRIGTSIGTRIGTRIGIRIGIWVHGALYFLSLSLSLLFRLPHFFVFLSIFSLSFVLHPSLFRSFSFYLLFSLYYSEREKLE